MCTTSPILIFHAIQREGKKFTVKNVACTSIFVIMAVNDVSLFLPLFSNSLVKPR